MPGEKHVDIDGVRCLRTAVPEQRLENILRDKGPGQKIVLAQLAGDSWVVKLAKQCGVPSILRIPSFAEYICTHTDKFGHCPRPCLSGKQCAYRVNRKVVKEATAVITSSQFAATAIKQFYNRDALVMYPPVDPEIHLVEKTGDRVTLINGVLQKGVNVFLEVARTNKKFPYLIVRNPPSLDTSWKGYDIQLLPGQNDMRKVWRQTKVLLVPSLVAESFGRVCVEASLNGIPVIASDRGGLPESAGPLAVFPLEDVKIWQQELDVLMTDPWYYRTRSEAARGHAMKFSMAASTDKFESLAEGLLSTRKGHTSIQVTVPVKTPRVAFFGPWIGEFGWEVATWQAWCRKQAKKYDRAYVCSFPGMEPLYRDFAEFVPHSYPRREVMWSEDRGVDLSKVKYTVPDDAAFFVKPTWKYYVDGEFVKFGEKPNAGCTCLIHAADHKTKDKFRKNYPKELWQEIVTGLPQDTACVGSINDLYVEGTMDKRGIPLDELMNLMAGSKIIVGGSAGPMHLAALCGTSIVVWGPCEASFEPLKERYKEAWNPFKVAVEYILANDWKPPPVEVLLAVERMLGKVT